MQQQQGQKQTEGKNGFVDSINATLLGNEKSQESCVALLLPTNHEFHKISLRSNDRHSFLESRWELEVQRKNEITSIESQTKQKVLFIFQRQLVNYRQRQAGQSTFVIKSYFAIHSSQSLKIISKSYLLQLRIKFAQLQQCTQQKSFLSQQQFMSNVSSLTWVQSDLGAAGLIHWFEMK